MIQLKLYKDIYMTRKIIISEYRGKIIECTEDYCVIKSNLEFALFEMT